MYLQKPVPMKNHLLFFLLFFASASGFAQITYTLKIKDTKRTPLNNVVVTAENKAENIVLTSTTNQTGTAVFVLEVPGVYTFSYLDAGNVAEYEVLEGFSGESSRTFTYDPKGVFAEKPAADRTGITFRTVPPTQLKGQAGMCRVNVIVKDKDKNPLPRVTVSVVSVPNKVMFTSQSNGLGEALFYVPINQTYEIDVENLPGFKVFTVGNHEGMEMIETVFFEKLKATEITKGDTILQRNITQTTGTSTHVLFTLTLEDYDGKPLPDEPVYAQAIDSKRVYEGMTDRAGNCSFMLEKGTDYVLNLKHENGIHLITAPHSKGFRTVSCGRRYRGSALIEQLLAEQKAEMERLQEELAREALRPKPGDKTYEITYKETPCEELAQPINYLTKTAEGFNIDFESSGPVGTPTVIGNKLYTQQGIYSSNYYCLNAQTGDFIWGLELGESGISPAVYHKGIILINTASCSLYAIDAETGKLLWSKWLAGYVYSTPTADENSVYVVYNHGGYPVLVSFDLITGDLKWIQRVDEEAIACPVVEGDEVHVASQSGVYYIFNKVSGELILMSNTFKVVSSPTLTPDKIYLTANFNGVEQLVVLDRKTLKLDKKYPATLYSLNISGDRNVDATDQMNFNGSHPIVYQNKLVILTDSKKIMAFDMLTEKMLWEQAVTANPDQLPIVSNEKVMLTTTTGEVIAYDVFTGKPTLIKKTEGAVEGQPIAKNGFLYLATGGIIVVIKTIYKLDWPQWNKDASHNTYWKE